MSTEVRCTGCGKTWTVAGDAVGQTVACPGCGGAIAVGAAAPLPPAPEPLVTVGQARTAMHIRMSAVFNLVLGGIHLLWAVFMVLECVVFVFIARQDRTSNAFPLKIMLILFAGMGVLSLLAGAVHLLGGVYLLKHKPGARLMGLVAGFVACACLWSYCVWPLGLAVGIYTLVILFRKETRRALEQAPIL
jgi:DNA-directed RNA polymerase subunit RPC12/RpoP